MSDTNDKRNGKQRDRKNAVISYVLTGLLSALVAAVWFFLLAGPSIFVDRRPKDFKPIGPDIRLSP